MLAAEQAAGHDDVVDPEDFREGLARSLADGSFRLVIVLDSAPDELVRVAGYLQSVTDKIDIDLVTVAVYDVAGSQVLVPQRMEPGRRMRELSDTQVTARQAGGLHPGSAEFRAVIAELPTARRDVLARLAPLTYTDEDPPAQANSVAPARRSAAAQAKASVQHDENGRPYRSFRGLLAHLGTLTRNQVRFAGTPATARVLSEPTSEQRQAFDLIGTPIPVALK